MKKLPLAPGLLLLCHKDHVFDVNTQHTLRQHPTESGMFHVPHMSIFATVYLDEYEKLQQDMHAYHYYANVNVNVITDPAVTKHMDRPHTFA
eukprot:scaffold39039_cov178-Skeletonema_dohrnii-CCMP3373.AAC.1